MKTEIPKAVPTIKLDKIDAVLKIDADAHRLVASKFLKIDTDNPPTTKAACENAGRCANGALLFHSSFPLKDLVKVQETWFTKKAYAFMKRVYGLLPIHMDAIIEVNDRVIDSQNNGKRYEEVMALLTFAEAMQQQGIRFNASSDLVLAYRSGFNVSLPVTEQQTVSL